MLFSLRFDLICCDGRQFRFWHRRDRFWPMIENARLREQRVVSRIQALTCRHANRIKRAQYYSDKACKLLKLDRRQTVI